MIRATGYIFKIANEYTLSNKAQYIASLNEDQLISMKEQLSNDEFETILTKNIILELTDKSQKANFRIQVDLHTDNGYINVAE